VQIPAEWLEIAFQFSAAARNGIKEVETIVILDHRGLGKSPVSFVFEGNPERCNHLWNQCF